MIHIVDTSLSGRDFASVTLIVEFDWVELFTRKEAWILTVNIQQSSKQVCINNRFIYYFELF